MYFIQHLLTMPHSSSSKNTSWQWTIPHPKLQKITLLRPSSEQKHNSLWSQSSLSHLLVSIATAFTKLCITAHWAHWAVPNPNINLCLTEQYIYAWNSAVVHPWHTTEQSNATRHVEQLHNGNKKKVALGAATCSPSYQKWNCSRLPRSLTGG